MEFVEDALWRRLLGYRQQSEEDNLQYIREALYRHESNLAPPDPRAWFKAPHDWVPDKRVKETFEALSGETLAGGENANYDSGGRGDIDATSGGFGRDSQRPS